MSDILRTDEAGQGIAAALRRRDDEGGTGCENRRNLGDHCIEAWRRKLKDAGLGSDGKAIDLRRRQIGNAGVGDDDALWGACGAGGVDDVGGVLGVERDGWGGGGLLFDGGGLGIEREDAASASMKASRARG